MFGDGLLLAGAAVTLLLMSGAARDDSGDDGPAGFTADELERGTDRLARLLLHAHALAERKRAGGSLDGSSPAAQQCLRRLEGGVELVRGALVSMLRQALGHPTGAPPASPGSLPAQRRAPER